MDRPPPPRFRTLDREECIAILDRNHVGRIAYAWQNHVDIEPLHYVYHDGWLYGRTSHGAKLDTTGTTWWPVAFEVDEVEGLFQWRSVVVHGGFYTVADDGGGDPYGRLAARDRAAPHAHSRDLRRGRPGGVPHRGLPHGRAGGHRARGRPRRRAGVGGAAGAVGPVLSIQHTRRPPHG